MLLQARAVCAGIGGVEFYEHLTGLHGLAFLDPHALDHAGFQRLQGLGAFAHDDAAGGHGHDVDLAERGPHEGDDEERAHRDRHPARRGVRGGGLQAQRGRQKGGFVGQQLRASQLSAHGPGGGEDRAVSGQQVDHRVAWGCMGMFSHGSTY